MVGSSEKLRIYLQRRKLCERMVDEWIESGCDGKESVVVNVSFKLDALQLSMAHVPLILVRLHRRTGL